jgi:hypothetical protein
VRTARRARYRRNPEKRRAQNKLQRAVRTGKLERRPCEVCGNPRVEAHHEDYSKPLDVIWLCQLHHFEHHAK